MSSSSTVQFSNHVQFLSTAICCASCSPGPTDGPEPLPCIGGVFLPPPTSVINVSKSKLTETSELFLKITVAFLVLQSISPSSTSTSNLGQSIVTGSTTVSYKPWFSAANTRTSKTSPYSLVISVFPDAPGATVKTSTGAVTPSSSSPRGT